MFTSIDKAIVAFLGAVAFLVNQFGIDVPSEWVGIAAAIATPLLTYLIPNKE